jgi:hypothetical protein
MNERIKLLAEHARDYADDEYKNFSNVSGWFVLYNEKFAELIVRECAKICECEWNGDADTFAASEAYNECAESIKEHFGVEE